MKSCWSLFATGMCAFMSCTSPLEKGPAVSFHNENALQPVVSFQTKIADTVSVYFWPKGHEDITKRSRNSTGISHEIVLLNLTPSTEYEFEIRTHAGDVIDHGRFVTKEIPPAFFNIQKIKVDTPVFDGHILIRRFAAPGADALIDSRGNIVWYHAYDTTVRRFSSWTPTNTILSIYDTSRIVETSLYGDRLVDINLKKSAKPQVVHHEIFYDHDANIIALTSDSAQYDLRKVGGGKKDYLHSSGMLKLNRRGELLWQWSLNRNVDVLKLFDHISDVSDRLGHANSIAIDRDGHYLISFRDFSQIWKIDSQNGSVIWKLGKSGNFSMDDRSYFIGQHSIHLDQGKLVMFDNGDRELRPNSRILVLSIDETNKIARTETVIELPIELSTYRMGSAYRIDTDKFLVATPKKDLTLAVVDLQGQVLWKVKVDQPSYRGYFIKGAFNGVGLSESRR